MTTDFVFDGVTRSLCDEALVSGAKYIASNSDDAVGLTEPFIRECKSLFVERFPEIVSVARRMIGLNMPSVARGLMKDAASAVGVQAAKNVISGGRDDFAH